jgi:hypothetical protein
MAATMETGLQRRSSNRLYSVTPLLDVCNNGWWREVVWGRWTLPCRFRNEVEVQLRRGRCSRYVSGRMQAVGLQLQLMSCGFFVQVN